MTYVLEDFIAESTATTGTGNITLDGALGGYRAFDSVLETGDTFPYVIEAGVERESGTGTYLGSNVFSRSVIRSTNANALINWGAGTKVVSMALLASDLAAPHDKYPAFTETLATAADVVATYIYDTTQDSDGGAWRERCAWTSWEQETLGTATRGVTRKFPAIALITVRPTSLTIYDKHDIDPATGKPRMWAVWECNGARQIFAAAGAREITNVFALNGRVYVTIATGSAGGGLGVADLTADMGYSIIDGPLIAFVSPISARNTNQTNGSNASYLKAGLVSRDCNSVHAAVLPGAPIDAAGLPIPTVAVATAAGTSVIHPDGRVYDVSTDAASARCAINADGSLWVYRSTGSAFGSLAPDGRGLLYRFSVPYADAGVGAAITVYAANSSVPATLSGSANHIPSFTFLAKEKSAIGKDVGLVFLSEDRTNPANGMVSYSAINYATGWQPGAIKGAWLCDGVTGNITAANVLNDDCSSTTGWTLGSGWAHDTTEFDHSSGTAALDRALTGLTVGQTYMLRVTTGNRSAGTLTVSLPSGGTLGGQTAITTDGTAILQIIATATTGTLRFTPTTDFDGSVQDVQIDVALPDRSFNGKPLRVVGTLGRAAVATGNDLVAVSGFSASNYLEQPYNPDLDFGTGDFFIGFWRRESTVSDTTTRMVLERDSTPTGARITLLRATTGVVTMQTQGSGFAALSSTSDLRSLGFRFVVFARRAGTLECWIDGIREATTASASNVSNADARLCVGAPTNAGVAADIFASTALLRTAAYAPTPRQIRQMYEDEKALFQTGAKAFLGGVSNLVKDLSRDPVTDQLAVATDDGVAVFDGLQRTAYYDSTNLAGAITSDNTRAVSMNRGALLIATAAEAGVYSPALPGRDAIIGHNGGPPLDDSKGTADMEGVTTDATPLVLAPRISVGERELVRGRALVMGRMYGATATERFSTVLEFTAYRDAGGNVTLSIAADDQNGVRWDTTGTAAIVTTVETTGTMDAAIVVDTTAQTVGVQVTGVAATRIAWLAKVEWTRISEDQRYA